MNYLLDSHHCFHRRQGSGARWVVVLDEVRLVLEQVLLVFLPEEEAGYLRGLQKDILVGLQLECEAQPLVVGVWWEYLPPLLNTLYLGCQLFQVDKSKLACGPWFDSLHFLHIIRGNKCQGTACSHTSCLWDSQRRIHSQLAGGQELGAMGAV